MSAIELPMIIEPSAVKPLIGEDNICLIDLSQADSYIRQHLPQAVFLDYSWIVRVEKPRIGLLPDAEQLSRIISSYGISEDTHVIAYDDEGGGRACRFLWTLQCVGHKKISLINGGLPAWLAEGLPTESALHFPCRPVTRSVTYTDEFIADKSFILEALEDESVIVLDNRSAMEHSGNKVFAERGGHIPGAVHFEWTQALDKTNTMKLKDAEQIKSELAASGVTPDKTIVCHCQSHHRSAHTCIVLNALGFTKVKGYPGSWSDWGNDPETPIET